MKFSSKQYAQALYDAVAETNPKDHDKVLDNFVKILAQNGDLDKHGEIEIEYHRLESTAKGIKEVDVTFAQEHNTKILDELNSVVQASGLPAKMEIKSKIDNTIIGGVIVRVDDTLIDASIKTQLNNLNNELRK